MKKWTVLLLRPDYIAGTFGHDTFCALVETRTPGEALYEAQQEACETDGALPESRSDYYCLMCIEGWHKDYQDGGGGVVDT